MNSQTVDPPTLKKVFPEVFAPQVSGWSVAKLAGDASSRSYFRLSNAENRSSFVLQVSEPFAAEQIKKHSFLAAQQLLQTLALPVPRIFGVRPDMGWILLEDLGDETLQTHSSLALYKKALDLLVEWTLRARVDNPEIASFIESPHFAWAFDVEKLSLEMGYTAEHLVHKLLGMDAERFKHLVAKNTDYLAARERYFCHRDYHCRNLMILNSAPYLIDFQDARMGPLTYDVVSLLWDPYAKLSDDWKVELLDYWEKLLRARSAQLGRGELPPKDWRVELERMKIQRLLKAAGSYASFLNLKGRRDYLPSIVPALNDTREAILKLGELGAQTSDDAQLLTWIESVEPRLPAILKAS
jgi:aminoglycoside/choline kinase family phosphotransferase